MIRVFLVDDHSVVRRGISQILDAEHGLEVVGESGSVRGTLGRVAATVPDIVVLDVRLPDGSGVDLCRSIRSEHPGIRCLMLTAFDDDTASAASVVAGASGYVLKTIRGSSLVDSIRRVANGEDLTPPAVAERVRARLASRASAPPAADMPLSLRERQILRLIAEGLTNRQIGEHLGLAEKTVKNYVSALLAKLGMQRRTQAAVYGAAERFSARATGDRSDRS
ncbi:MULTISPECIES: response regulator transcription factor [unclassified Microbacterium]|uniref:response regulator transcription factor n=1 Tax=unclassified Microbacterium TaxID=2609290 RepID=UPI000D00EBF6|nr:MULTISPECIES: response regulator transcription factor [unclassified Microbacterium]PRB65765.1 DNA-binding response regulator [Microbacterium sp. MYb45]